MWVDNLGFGKKLLVIVAVAALGIVAVFAVSLAALDRALTDSRILKVRHLVDAAHTLVGHFEAAARDGRLTETEAQTQALAALKAMRYGENDYFWVIDQAARMVMHPIKPELDGKPMADFRDPDGLTLFAAAADTAAAQGQGLVFYKWPKPGFDQPVRKVSYVRGFTPWGWVLGTGIYLDDIAATFRQAALVTGAITAGVTVLALALSLFVARRTTRSLGGLAGDMAAIADGHLARPVGAVARRDEVGTMARALEVFKRNAVERERLKAERDQSAQAAQHQRRADMLTLADRLDQRVNGLLTSIDGAVERLNGSAATLSANADQTQRHSAAVSAATDEATADVATVSAAGSQLTASIDEISRQVTQAASMASGAAFQVDEANRRIGGLVEAAGRIGDVVGIINDIAAQTNLLALNATIESARAGEAGKGFAVVAGEVKHLAGQTARATGEISQQIGAVQDETREAVDAIRAITETITRINELSTTIAVAVEQQGAATAQIARNVEHASAGTRAVAHNIGDVATAAHEPGEMAHEVSSSAAHLLAESHALHREIADFLVEVRAG